MLIVKGAKPSPFVRKVIIALEEKGVPYELQNLGPVPKTPELLAMNPLGKIPILQDGEHHIPDSSVIIAYIERIHPERSVYPENAIDYARALFLEEYADTKMVEAIGGLFFESFVKVHVFQQEKDEAACAAIIENQLPPLFEQLEGMLEDGATTLLSRFCVADIAVGCQLVSLTLCGVEIDSKRYPKLAQYAAAVTSRPSFKAAFPS